MPNIPNMMNMLQSQFSGTSQPVPVPIIRYAFLFTPPAGSAGIDWTRLLIPVDVVMLLTLGAVLTFRTPPVRVVPEG